MINFNGFTNENKINHNPKWPFIPDHWYKILIIGGSGSEKTSFLLNLLNYQQDIYKVYLYAKDLFQAIYQFLINKSENVGLKHCNDRNAFIECSIGTQDVYKDIEEYNPGKERKYGLYLMLWWYD